MTQVIIGIDVGTTKLGATAIDVATGTLLAVESVPNNAHVSSVLDGSEQDACVVIDTAIGLLATLMARTELQGTQVCALGVTGQMHGVVLVADDGTPLTNLISWQDRRGTHPYAATGRSYAEEVAFRLGDAVPARTGSIPATGYGAVTLLRAHTEGELPSSGTALTIHDALVKALCGRAVTDPTDAASWGVFDSAAGQWLDGIDAAFPFMRHYLPEVAPTGSIAGQLSTSLAALIGLPAGLPVAVALGDNQASFLGSVPSPTASVLMNLGTGGQMSTTIDRFVYQAPLETRPFVDGRWLMVGASLCGGRAYQVLESFYRQLAGDLFKLPLTDHLYERMNKLAAMAADDCDGLCVSTLFEGSRLHPEERGAISGITTANLTPANLTRAVIQGMTDELLGFYDIARQAGAQPTILCGAGNAVRRNPIVSSEMTRRMALPLTLPAHAEEAAVGAALAAGVASGIFPNWEAATSTVFKKNE